MQEKKPNRAKGGEARAAALTVEQRKEIARNAARARWKSDGPIAKYEGEFDVGESSISAAVLEDGRRIITQSSFLRAIGRSRSPKAGTGVLSTVDVLPFFLQADALKPFISNELELSSKPVFYQQKNGSKGVGYNAEILPEACEVYLRMRDAALAKTGKVPVKYEHIIAACDVLMRGLARVGVIALVDEATGYQEIRDRRALQEILDQYLRKELATWAKRFPDEFYKQIFRLRNWEWKGMKVNRPQVVARYTNDLVYERLAPGVLLEIETRNPKTDSGYRKSKHHQWLSDDVGHPALTRHIDIVTNLMKVADSWDQLKLMVDRALPKYGNTIEMDL